MKETDRFKLRQTYQSINAAAGVDHVDWVCPAGVSALVIQAIGRHDDNAAARVVEFMVVKGGVNYSLTVSRTLVNGVNDPIYYASYMNTPLLLRYGHTLRWYCWGIAAGKIATMQLHLEQRLGDDTYGD